MTLNPRQGFEWKRRFRTKRVVSKRKTWLQTKRKHLKRKERTSNKKQKFSKKMISNERHDFKRKRGLETKARVHALASSQPATTEETSKGRCGFKQTRRSFERKTRLPTRRKDLKRKEGSKRKRGFETKRDDFKYHERIWNEKVDWKRRNDRIYEKRPDHRGHSFHRQNAKHCHHTVFATQWHRKKIAFFTNNFQVRCDANVRCSYNKGKINSAALFQWQRL